MVQTLQNLFATPWTVAYQAPLSSTISWNLLKFMSTELVMLSNHLILCHPLLFLHWIFPSIRVFSSESVLRIRWPKHQSFSFSISPSNSCSWLISFRIDWFGLLAVQGILESSAAPQFESINSSMLNLLYGSTFTSVHDYWKNHIQWLYRLLSAKYLSSNMLSRFVKAFLPKSKHLSFTAAATICSDSGAPKLKSLTVCIVSPTLCHEVIGPDAMTLKIRIQINLTETELHM